MTADERLDGRYALERLPLAPNGMGEVWLARDERLRRPVVVKFLAATSTDLVRRFQREALLTARLDHPGVPAVYDLGVDRGGRPYLILQRIHGFTLTDVAAEHDPLPIAWVAAIGAQICSVLVAAQEIGLVHRDVKPSNVMLERSGAVKVLDFGLAVIRDDDRYSQITRTGESLGTVGYMAPEQIMSQPTDHRTDLYGLGATLFHLLTGQPPFDDATTSTTVRHQLIDPPPRPSRLRPDTPGALDDLVHALLANDPCSRPTSAIEVYRGLAPFVGPLPALLGMVDDGPNAVRSYAAVVGQLLIQPPAGTAPQAGRDELDPAHADAKAQTLYEAGEFRAAARCWRQLVEAHTLRYGHDHPQTFEWRHRIAQAHLRVGERDRALRELDLLLQDRIRADDDEHPDVLALRQEIAQLRTISRRVLTADP